MIRKISAHYVFPVSSSPIKNGIIVIDENGKILDIENPKNNFVESSGLEFYNGILVPGFVNTHCHIELSHLKGKIKEKTGLPDFASQISNIRITDEEIIKEAIKLADKVMELSGIVAVGDISNTNFSFETKQKSKIKYHTFLEVFSMDENKAEFVFEKALKLKFELENLNLSSSIVPHAPYSVSDKLFELIKNESVDSGKTITIHNQETVFENQLFINKTGELYDKLNSIGVNYDNFKISGKNSLETISSKLS
ncbi:MAG: amidohydrolase family protein, partial [Bacteroidales bacterium]|nr:amidohydrolase family protein [Bacteroidales bacterium]